MEKEVTARWGPWVRSRTGGCRENLYTAQSLGGHGYICGCVFLGHFHPQVLGNSIILGVEIFHSAARTIHGY